MIRFLLQRPISVLMAFLALCIVGLVLIPKLPVSLLPDIPIPEITVQLSSSNTSARELENTVVRPIRDQLNQLGGLQDIRAETRDGNSIVRLRFEYGTNTDLAFIEVNEKIDAAMNYLPKGTSRPRVVKASATDIPVEFLNLTLRSDRGLDGGDEVRFLELSEYAETVVRRRIEQLPEVTMVDITGLARKEVIIVPDQRKLQIAGITLSDIEQTLNSNNIEPGGMIVRDGHYEYTIRFSTVLRTLDDVKNLFIRKNDRIYRLTDLAEVRFAAALESGMALYNDQRCVRLAVIKQADVNMDDMQKALDIAVDDLIQSNPEMEIHTTENQTELLDYTISNLKQNLLLAFLFVWLISVVFIHDLYSPLVIGISMVVSVVVCLLLFYLFGLSVNVVSLTGLILASGNMIDNSIVVSDNITQYRRRGWTPDTACVTGTSEVMGPMLSSALSSVAVFAPLIFLSGIAGALFLDQALSVSIGMLVSYVTGIVLLPVLYKVFSGLSKQLASNPIGSKGQVWLESVYHRGINWVFSHKRSTALVSLLMLPFFALLFYLIPKEKMPDLHQNEVVVSIDWNENIHIAENLNRSRALLRYLNPKVEQQTGLVGEQQFLLDRIRQKTSSETELYIKVTEASQLFGLEQEIRDWLETEYPKTLVSFAPAATIFERVFTTAEADLVVECYPTNREKCPQPFEIDGAIRKLTAKTGIRPDGIPFQQQLNIRIDQEKLLYYNVSYSDIYLALKTAFQVNRFATLRSYQQYLPVVMGFEQRTVENVLANTLISVSNNLDGTINRLSLNRFVETWVSHDLKAVVAGKSGEFVPLVYKRVEQPEALIKAANQTLNTSGNWNVSFSGGFFSNRKMIGELMIILLISLLLMYFILVAQFESFIQPLIILMEIPIDLAASLGLLMLIGHSLNLMSAIGMIVTCGIVINDSILKVDVMNQLRKEGLKLKDAIHEAGRRRLNAILMTSLTSIVCMVPLLFTNDLGSNLEKPLALATIGGMLIGTPVSLFVVPLLYWWIYRKQDKTQTAETSNENPSLPNVVS